MGKLVFRKFNIEKYLDKLGKEESENKTYNILGLKWGYNQEKMFNRKLEVPIGT